MKRKRWIKLMMSYGVSRNDAVWMASARNKPFGIKAMTAAKLDHIWHEYVKEYCENDS